MNEAGGSSFPPASFASSAEPAEISANSGSLLSRIDDGENLDRAVLVTSAPAVGRFGAVVVANADHAGDRQAAELVRRTKTGVVEVDDQVRLPHIRACVRITDISRPFGDSVEAAEVEPVAAQCIDEIIDVAIHAGVLDLIHRDWPASSGWRSRCLRDLRYFRSASVRSEQ